MNNAAAVDVPEGESDLSGTRCNEICAWKNFFGAEQHEDAKYAKNVKTQGMAAAAHGKHRVNHM